MGGLELSAQTRESQSDRILQGCITHSLADNDLTSNKLRITMCLSFCTMAILWPAPPVSDPRMEKRS